MEGDYSRIIVGVLIFVMGAIAWTTFWGGAFDSYNENPNVADSDTFDYTSDIRDITDDMQEAMSPGTDPSLWDYGTMIATGTWGSVRLAFESISVLWDVTSDIFSDDGLGFIGLGWVAPILMAIISLTIILAVVSVVMKRKL